MPSGPVWAVVLAAGASVRYGRPKQFERLGEHRVVDWSVGAARQACDGVVVALPPGVRWDGDPAAIAVEGGATHAESARAAVAAVPDSAAVIVIMTASHPLVSPDLVLRAADASTSPGVGAAVAVYPFADMLVRHDGTVITEVVSKAGAVVAQSPSGFDAALIRRLMQESAEASFEVELVTRAGGRVAMVPGEATNLHVTTPEELAVATALLPLVGWSPAAP